MQLPAGKKAFFLSDFHLGAPDAASSRTRELHILSFLEEKEPEMGALFLVGDLFDFWYEYRRVVPRGYVRLLGRLATLADRGIPLHVFVGNHDMWMKDYFQQELGAQLYFGPQDFTFNNRLLHVAHGDGLGPGDHKYKAMKKVFRNPVCQWLFGLVPPQIGIGLADYFSRKSRAATGTSEEKWLGDDKEWLLQYSYSVLKEKKVDYFVFGHRHLPVDYRLNEESRYINLGDWIRYFTFAELDGGNLHLKAWSGGEDKIIRRP